VCAALLHPPREQCNLPPNLAAVCLSAATGDFGDGDERKEGDEGDEVEEEGKEPADDNDGYVAQESDLDEFSSLSVSLPPAQITPSRSRPRSSCPPRLRSPLARPTLFTKTWTATSSWKTMMKMTIPVVGTESDC